MLECVATYTTPALIMCFVLMTYGLSKIFRCDSMQYLSITNDLVVYLVKVMYNCVNVINGPILSNWTKSMYTVNQ